MILKPIWIIKTKIKREINELPRRKQRGILKEN